MTPEEIEKKLLDLDATVAEQAKTIASQSETIKEHVKLIADHSDGIAKAKLDVENHGKLIAEVVKKVDAAPSAVPSSATKIERFKGQAAVNKDTSGKPENEFHFSVGGDNFRFLNDSVSLPAGSALGAHGTRVTALVAQGSTSLQALLVKQNSGQIVLVK